MLHFVFCVMLAVCLWVAPVAQAAPSYSSTTATTSYGEKPDALPVASEADEPREATLMPDVERTAMIRRGRVPRTFSYLARKGEQITVQVTAVSFSPQVFVKDPSGADVKIESSPDGERSLEVSVVLGEPGRYIIGVRSQNASNGLFHITLSSGTAADAGSP